MDGNDHRFRKAVIKELVVTDTVSGLPAATKTAAGVVEQALHVAPAAGAVDGTYDATTQATITNLQTQFNALLTSLQNAGTLASS